MLREARREPPIREIPGKLDLRTSAALGWRTMFVSTHRASPFEGTLPETESDKIFLHRQRSQVEYRSSGIWRRIEADPATIHMIPRDVSVPFRLHDTINTVAITLDRSVVNEVLTELLTRDPVNYELPHRLQRSSATLLQLINSVEAALEEATHASAIYAEYASRALVVQLLSECETIRDPLIVRTGYRGKSREMSRAVEFMRDNLGARIMLSDIAAAAGLSVTVLCREFRTAFGTPPHQFLIGLRLKEAQNLLRDKKTAIAEVAAICGFSNQEHLTLTFRKQLGITPSAFRGK